MLADRWLTKFLVYFLSVFMLAGCFPRQTEEALTRYAYLSSWIQAIGSLLAVWATFFIYRRNTKDNVEREKRIDREKAEEQRRTEERNRRLLQIECLGNPDVSRCISGINEFIMKYEIFALHTLKMDFLTTNVDFNDYYVNLFGDGVPLFKHKDLQFLVDAFGDDLVEMQQSSIRLNEALENIRNKSKAMVSMKSSKNMESLDFEEISYKYNLSIFNENAKILREKFQSFRPYAEI